MNVDKARADSRAKAKAKARSIQTLREKQAFLQKRHDELRQQLVRGTIGLPDELLKVIKANRKCRDQVEALQNGLDPRLLILDVLST